jgi:ankyrin repeat protein
VNKHSRLTGVTGALGVGKTTFAAAVAHSSRVQDCFARICWLALDESTERPITALQAQLSAQLGGTADSQPPHWRVGLASLSEQASKALAARERLLIVVDDPLGSMDNVVAALQVHPNSTLLVCSENYAALQSLAADPLADPGPMSMDESLDLLAQWCHCSPDELPKAAQEIVEAVGGLPLAVTIAGAMVSLAGDRDAEWGAVRQDIAAGRVEQLHIPGLENANIVAIFRRGLGSLGQKNLDDLHTLAVLPADWPLKVQALRVLWQTNDDNDARRRADQMVTRSLLRRPGVSDYTVHRLLRLALRALDDRLTSRFKEVADRISPATPALVLALLWHEDQIFKTLVLNADAQEVNRATPQGVTPLHQASLLGMVDTARLLLQCGADPRREDEGGFCALQYAAQGGEPATIRLLLGLSLDPARKNHGGKTALDIAARFGHVEAVRLISADSRAVRASRFALAVAALDGHEPVVDQLLSADADPDDADGISPPLLAAALKGRVSIIKRLLEAGASVDQVSKEQTPLFAAATEGDTDTVALLITARADVNWKTATDRTPLHQAAQSGKVEIVEDLIGAGALVAVADLKGLTPLHIAASLGHAGVVQSLIRHGSQLDRLDGDELTPLHRAVHKTHAEVVQVLLSAGANPDVVGQKGFTPLLLAVAYAPPGLVQRTRFSLDERGMSGSSVTVYTPVSASTVRITRLLAADGADLNAADAAGQTALHWAVRQRSLELESLLLELGADRDKRDQDGRTPLDLVRAIAQTGTEEEPLVGLRMRALASLLSH